MGTAGGDQREGEEKMEGAHKCRVLISEFCGVFLSLYLVNGC